MFIERLTSPNKIKQRKTLVGVGVNDSPYVVVYTDSMGRVHKCPYYRTWVGMLTRACCPKFHTKFPTYKECTVEPSWKLFSNFRAWMQMQDWEGKELDKDLLCWGNKHYGPNTCLFVSRQINTLLILRTNHRGNYPLGVSKRTYQGRYTYFEATCSINGKPTHLGLFKTPEEAAEVYKQAKLKYIAELAKTEPNPRIKAALLALH